MCFFPEYDGSKWKNNQMRLFFGSEEVVTIGGCQNITEKKVSRINWMDPYLKCQQNSSLSWFFSNSSSFVQFYKSLIILQIRVCQWWRMEPIRCQFHQHLRARFLYEFRGQRQNVTRKAAKKDICMKKARKKTLMKLTAGVNFINFLRAAFSRKRVFLS